ncbi:thioredoxin family protein [Lactovum miscens]|uniref:Thiol-disulfide isomerase/thioredoxin n=1 Tax=Lactovum miscens TaxID=190387 RepID=A0A841C8G0_9LACT|nr:thioredoxin family protein [Lactovum miscens]MBB5888018.1 thiol-disulfide isomerase/thioredoxin [Lactovum miscens]
MIFPENIENLATLVNGEGKTVFFFSAGWCSDCAFIKPKMPEIEAENPEFKFVEVDRDEYIDVAQEWDIFGIPSFVVLENGKEIGRLVNKARKTKDEVNSFLSEFK